MFFPRQDNIFGSFYFAKRGLTRYFENCEFDRGPCAYRQSYKLERTHWKTLNTKNQRCDDGSSRPNTTSCITQYLDKKIGCSMGLHGADPYMKRYYI